MALFSYTTSRFFDEVLAYTSVSSYVGQPNTRDVPDIINTLVNLYNSAIIEFGSRMSTTTVFSNIFKSIESSDPGRVLSGSGVSVFSTLYSTLLDWKDEVDGTIIEDYSMDLPIQSISCISGTNGIFNSLVNFPTLVAKALRNSSNIANEEPCFFLSALEGRLYTNDKNINLVCFALPLPPIRSYTNTHSSLIQYNPFTLPYLDKDAFFCEFLKLRIAARYCYMQALPIREGLLEESERLLSLIERRCSIAALAVTGLSDLVNR